MNYTLMEHQKKALDISRGNDAYCFFHDMGTGKTLTGIEIIKDKDVKTLIVCPVSLIKNAWIVNLKKWSPELLDDTVNLWQLWSKKNRKNGLDRYQNAINDCKIAIINYEGLKNQFKYLEKAGFEMILLDESSKVKNPKAKATKLAHKICDNIKYRYLFSGSPAARSELDYFSQIRIAFPSLWGKRYYAWREKYFNPKGDFWFTMKPEIVGQFKRELASISDVVRRDEVLDLPEQTFTDIEVELSSVEAKAYKEMKKHYLYQHEKEFHEASTTAVKLLKLREITSGFIDKQVIGDSKLNALLELLEEIGNHQVVIWTNFNVECDEIMKAIPDKCVRIDGTVKHADREDRLERFLNGKAQYLLSKPSCLGHGENWVHCNYMIHYSSDYNLDTYIQSLARIHRYGQKNTCSYYTLLATINGTRTIDHFVQNSRNNKENMMLNILLSCQKEK